MKALLVEDSRAMRSFLGSIVRELGFEYAEADNGLDALEKLSTCDLPDLLLLDWNMPKMGGFELLTRLRADDRYAAMRIVMVTSENEMEAIVAALDAGADEFVMKPFEAAELAAKLVQIGLLKEGPAA
jgi:two-component system chemotaxis response regulator CheY